MEKSRDQVYKKIHQGEEEKTSDLPSIKSKGKEKQIEN